LPDDTEITTDEAATHTPQLASLSNYLDTALSNRQELKQLDLQNRVADINIKSIKATQLPTFAVGATAYYIDANANPIPQNNQFITPITLGATLSWNFGTLWNTKSKLATAKIQQQETSINKGLTTDYLKTEVNRNYQTYAAAVHKIELLQTAIAQANENNKILESKYQRNVASATDRVDAQTLLYQAQINLELARADAGLAYYNLLKSTGKLNK
jgi:outer membrane protein